MPHQCVKCGKIYTKASQQILTGCGHCGGKFFFFVRDEQLKKLEEEPLQIPEEERQHIEEDVREMIAAVDDDAPVILDLESIRVVSPGKFEIDLVNLFNKRKPLIYKLEEGKYVIDLSASLQRMKDDEKE